jgi:GNAT superfamily N-acetyltransferase
VGAIRLSFDSEECYLRDLQVSEEFRNKGIGAAELVESTRLAQASGVKKLKLRVLKISPAYHLYKRNGFTLVSEDERF